MLNWCWLTNAKFQLVHHLLNESELTAYRERIADCKLAHQHKKTKQLESDMLLIFMISHSQYISILSLLPRVDSFLEEECFTHFSFGKASLLLLLPFCHCYFLSSPVVFFIVVKTI